MAAPIMHIVLALKILTLLPDTIDPQEFILGTSFPDIRHMANLSRQSTHIEPISWQDIVQEPSSFRAGMLFHNLVDILRITNFEFELAYFDRYNPKAYTKAQYQLFPLAMKFSEDIALYEYVTDWQKVSHYFDHISTTEKALCADESLIMKWHSALQEYIKSKPDFNTIDKFLDQTNSNLNFKINPSLFDMHHTTIKLLGDFKFHTKIRNFYENFETMLPVTPVITPPFPE